MSCKNCYYYDFTCTPNRGRQKDHPRSTCSNEITIYKMLACMTERRKEMDPARRVKSTTTI